MLADEKSKLQTLDQNTGDVLRKLQTPSNYLVSADVCKDLRTALTSCYKTGGSCTDELKAWKACEETRK
jgi:hypothetical protein